MNTQPLKVGTRGSALARWQSKWVRQLLASVIPERAVELTIVRTTGDQQSTVPLESLGGDGVFTKEIQHALIREDVDLAVHSLKDLPTEPVEGLILAAVPPRGPVEDVLILPEKEKGSQPLRQPFEDCIRDLECIGTGSLRRRAQLRHYHSSLNLVEIRGNVETRIQKLDAGNCDALVLAHAGIRRLGLEKRIDYVMQPEVMLPAVGQGAIGIECRVNDKDTRAILKIIDDPQTHLSVLAERSLLSTLRAGCHAPLGSLARIQNNHLHLQAVVLSPDGQQRLTAMDQIPCAPDNQPFESSAPRAINLGKSVARTLIAEGAESLISMANKQP